MKIQQIILSIVFNLVITSCQGATLQNKPSNYIQNDSIKIVASYFLTQDVFINSFVVSDRDIEETYQMVAWALLLCMAPKTTPTFLPRLSL